MKAKDLANIAEGTIVEIEFHALGTGDYVGYNHGYYSCRSLILGPDQKESEIKVNAKRVAYYGSIEKQKRRTNTPPYQREIEVAIFYKEELNRKKIDDFYVDISCLDKITELIPKKL